MFFIDKKTKRAILLISLILFFVSSFISRSTICCFFGSVRYFGWPNAFASISKSTDSYKEAIKVYTETTPYLLNNGWKIHFYRGGGDTGDYGLTAFPFINTLLNYLICLTIPCILVFLIRLFNIEKK